MPNEPTIVPTPCGKVLYYRTINELSFTVEPTRVPVLCGERPGHVCGGCTSLAERMSWALYDEGEQTWAHVLAFCLAMGALLTSAADLESVKCGPDRCSHRPCDACILGGPYTFVSCRHTCGA